MKILLTCGGTAGHINPALAIARLFQERKPSCQVLFVGAKGGMEERLIPREGFDLETVTISSFRRKLNWSGIKHNLKTVYRLQKSRQEARAIIEKFGPDLVVGTGGYASYPVVREASKQKIPTAVHESNATPGLTTKRLSQYVDRILVGFEESRSQYGSPDRVVLTGTPVRSEFFTLTKKEAKEKLGIPADRLLVLSYWGSLGADLMNRYMIEFIAQEAGEGAPFHHIHGAGRSFETMTKTLEDRQVSLADRIQVLEYIYDMPCVMAAADLVLCRGGASTISELTSLGKAAIIVPSPNVTNRHQEKNAEVLAAEGAAHVILEPECDGSVLYQRVRQLLKDHEARNAMERAMAAAGIPDAADRIYETLVKLLETA